jgi:hypothetical protein
MNLDEMGAYNKYNVICLLVLLSKGSPLTKCEVLYDLYTTPEDPLVTRARFIELLSKCFQLSVFHAPLLDYNVLSKKL